MSKKPAAKRKAVSVMAWCVVNEYDGLPMRPRAIHWRRSDARLVCRYAWGETVRRCRVVVE